MEQRNATDQKEKRVRLLVTAGIFAAGLLISGLLWLRNGVVAGKEAGPDALVAVVEAEGEALMVLPLSENGTFPVETESGKNVIRIEDGCVSVTEADCPNQICVHTKPVSKEGETIVCLPHRVVVTVARKSTVTG